MVLCIVWKCKQSFLVAVRRCYFFPFFDLKFIQIITTAIACFFAMASDESNSLKKKLWHTATDKQKTTMKKNRHILTRSISKTQNVVGQPTVQFKTIFSFKTDIFLFKHKHEKKIWIFLCSFINQFKKRWKTTNLANHFAQFNFPDEMACRVASPCLWGRNVAHVYANQLPFLHIFRNARSQISLQRDFLSRMKMDSNPYRGRDPEIQILKLISLLN